MLKLLVFITCVVLSGVLGSQEYVFSKVANGSFKLHQVPDSWQGAFITCHAEGAVLASPINTEIENMLRIYMFYNKIDRPIHLGTTAMNSEGIFVSIEGVQLDSMPVTLGSFGDGFRPGNCLSLAPDGKINTSKCSQYLPYFCYKHGEQKKSNECGDVNYKFNAKTSSCYKLHSNKKTWSEAYKTCLSEGAYLVVLNDRLEADVIRNLFPVVNDEDFDNVWNPVTHVGMLDWNNDFTWLTVTGEKLENVYNTWAPGQPSGKGTNMCVALLQEGTLDSFSCGPNKLRFVCEKSRKR